MTASSSSTAPQGGMPRAERAAWIAVATVWATYVLARTLDAEVVVRITKGLLIPMLLLWAWTALGRAIPRWLVAGLVFATIGDIAIDIRFEAGMLGFLVMQLCYIAGFLALGAARGLLSRWPVGVLYAGICVGANVVLGPALGDLRIPVLVYSLAICVMAALASGVSRRVGIGALLFLLSDALLGMGKADVDFAGRAFLVMPMYLAGQYLITTGWVRRVRPEIRLPI
jgi:uncharacterized membrane protein YhhN